MLILWILLAQGVIHGTVRSSDSLEPVPYAVVELAGAERRVQADEDGYYVLAGVQHGRHEVIATGLGFGADTLGVDVTEAGTVRLDFLLEQRPVMLPSISATVRSEGSLVPAPTSGPAPVRVTAQSISRTPGLAEPDVLRTVQTLPSFAAASDFSSALYVRGSPPDQTAVTVDGAPLFNPYHLGGVFAAVDPSAVASVEARPGALPAGAADRLAGSVDILTRDGGRDRIRSDGALGLLSSRLSVDGPLPGRRGSFLLSARRTYLDLITGAAEAIGAIPDAVPYGFTDAHLKLTQDVGAAGRLSASGYLNREGLEGTGRETVQPAWTWGTFAGSVGYRGYLPGAATLNFRLAASAFDATLYGWDAPDTVEDTVAQGEIPVSRSDVGLLQLRTDLSVPRRSHTVRLGVEARWYSADHLVESRWTALEQVLPSLEAHARFRTLAGYIEDEWMSNSRIGMRVGARFLRVGARDPLVLPRIGMRYRLNGSTFLTLGGGRYAQPIRSLRNEEARLSSVFAYDLITEVPPEAPIPTAEDVVLGLEWANLTTSVRVEGFAKWLHDLPLVRIQGDPEEAPVLAVTDLQPESGRVLGLELLATHEADPYDLTLSYALTAARQSVGGTRYSPRYVRRHLVDLSASRTLGENGILSTRLAFGSGQPTTPVIGILQPYRYDPTRDELVPTFGVTHVYGPHNTGTLPAYVRLDAALRTTFDRVWFGRPVKVTPYFQVVNILNRANPVWTEVDLFGGISTSEGPRLPILPSLGVEWRF